MCFLYYNNYMHFLTIDRVRKEIQDRFPSDNEIEQDLFFSDDEILYAMEQAANMYNDITPRGVDVVHPQHLPANTNVFIDAVTISLYKQAIHKLTRNLITWQTGNTTVDLDKTRLQAFQAAQDALRNLWIQEAKDRKISINRELAWAYM